MSNKKLEKELIALEIEYWQALKDGDATAAIRLTDDPCLVTGAQGVARIDHDKFESMFKAPNWTLEDFELTKVEARVLSPDVAIVAYEVREEMTVDGKPLTLEAADSSTWVRRRGRWVCALHTEALSGDPFGRDRQAMT